MLAAAARLGIADGFQMPVARGQPCVEGKVRKACTVGWKKTLSGNGNDRVFPVSKGAGIPPQAIAQLEQSVFEFTTKYGLCAQASQEGLVDRSIETVETEMRVGIQLTYP